MNKIIPSIRNAKPVEHYKLFVEFEDGVNGIIDLNGWKGVLVIKWASIH